MKKIIIFLLLSNFSWAQNAVLDTHLILIGEQTNLTISNKITLTNNWPTYEAFLVNGVEIIKYSKIDTIEDLILQTFTITAWDSGHYYIPSISFSKDVKTDSLLLNVQAPILKEGSDLKDIKEPINAKISWNDIWPWLIIIIVIILLILLIKKYLFKTQDQIEYKKEKIVVPPYIIALKELDMLSKAKLWEKGNIKEHQAKISEITRRYIENRFRFIALELTTDEIVYHLKKKVNSQQLTNIKLILQRSDLAKFAKSQPNKNENIESIKIAEDFVNNTKYNQIEND